MLMLILISAIFFAVLIFPYNDLSDLLMARAADQGVYLEFSNMGLSFLPPSLRLDKVSVETAMFPTINAGEVYLAPNLMGLLTFSPGFSASVVNFLKGSLYINYRLGHKSGKPAVRLQDVNLSLNNLDLKGLSRFAELPISLNGRVHGQISGQFDPNFSVQPKGDAKIEIHRLHIPAAMVPAWMALTLPDTRISNVDFSGTLANGHLNINNAVIGRPGDDVFGRVKADIQLKVKTQSGLTYTDVGPYQVSMDLTLAPKIEKNFGGMLSLLNFDQYKSVAADGTRYALKLTGNGPGAPPTPGPLDPNTF